MSLLTFVPTTVASSSTAATGSLQAKSAVPVPQGRQFNFKATLTNSGLTTENFVVVQELVSPGGTVTPFLYYKRILAPGESYATTRWVSSAKIYPEIGDFTIRMTVGGMIVAQLTYAVGPPDVPLPTFEDVTAAAGVGAYDGAGAVVCEIGEGAAWADIDGDTDLDLFVPSLEPLASPHKLYINDGTGTFTDQGPLRGITDNVPGMGAAFVDYDNDGDADLYRSNDGPNQLYRNDGSGHFTDVAAAVGVADERMTQSAAWGDYDKDGLLDLYVVNYADCSGPGDGFPGVYEGDSLFRQRPDGTFEDVTALLPATPVHGAGFQASFFDYDGDGDLDIYVANDYLKAQPVPPDHNRLFRNDLGSFTDVSVASGLGYSMNSMGVAIGDPDRDLDLDLVISNIGPEKHARNNGDGTFTSIEASSNIEESKGSLPSGNPDLRSLWTWGEVMGDWNNDGWEDTYAAASHMMSSMNGDARPNRVLVNGRDGKFLDVSAASFANDRGASRGVVVADFDRDGKLDILSVNKGGPPVLYRNTTVGAGNWLEISTVGTISNRDGCGAKVILTSASGTQRRDVFCGSTSLSSGVDRTLHFGLGSDTSVSSVVITWPSGIVQTVAVAGVNSHVTVTEG